MANLYDAMFLLSFAACLGITLGKLYNVMSVGKWYDIKVTWVLFVSYVLAFFVALVTLLVDKGSELLYPVLFNVLAILLLLNVLLLVVELFFHVRETSINPMKAKNSRAERGG